LGLSEAPAIVLAPAAAPRSSVCVRSNNAIAAGLSSFAGLQTDDVCSQAPIEPAGDEDFELPRNANSAYVFPSPSLNSTSHNLLGSTFQCACELLRSRERIVEIKS
jgi:hypothetical protein